MTERHATLDDVTQRSAAAFAPSRHIRIGAEVEWLVFDRDDPSLHIPAVDAAHIASGRLPAGGTVTIEPGGQVELVTPPHDGPRQLIDAIEVDTRVLARRFADHRLILVPLGLDPIRKPRRTLEVARYQAMERHFVDVSPAGVRMMNLTASLQLNLDFGPDPDRAWERAHTVAPLLAAAFANSPTTDGHEFRPVSHRMRIWADTDPTRTRLVGPVPADWLPYVLDALVIPSGLADRIGHAAAPRSFRAWLDSTEPPTLRELDRHITTLFPPVRPRGYLEFRMIDALPAPGRAAAIAAVWALMVDDRVGEFAAAACRAIDDPWEVARRDGLENPQLGAVARTVLDVIAHRTKSVDEHLADAVVAWGDRAPSDKPADLLESAEATA